MSNEKDVPEYGLVDENLYPPPELSHEDVVKDPTMFWNTFKNFHDAMGSTFMIPIIGGQRLNLHTFYVEVTRRGGYDKVVSNKKWREISMVFNFSETTTSASYTLRKHYEAYLRPYEQVYFFRLRTPVESSISSCSTEFEATGTIDGKLDCGYLVSVKVGSETLKGILYHPVQPGASSSSANTQSCNAIVPYNGDSESCNAIVPYNGDSDQKMRRRRKKRNGDPSRPKTNRSGYNFFFAERHQVLKSEYQGQGREREFTNMIAESWNNLTEEEKMVYQNLGAKDKERYQREKKEYEEGIMLRQQEEIAAATTSGK